MCFAIAGPGSTNMLTGLYDARLDNSPVVAISGQVPSDVRGKGAFQDLDLATVFGDVAVSSVTIESGSDHAELAAEAVKHSLDGPADSLNGAAPTTMIGPCVVINSRQESRNASAETISRTAGANSS